RGGACGGSRRAGRRVMSEATDRSPTPALPRVPRTKSGEGREGPAPEVWQGGGEPSAAAALIAARRIVLKIGSALLVADDGEIRRARLEALGDDVARCRRRGQGLIA